MKNANQDLFISSRAEAAKGLWPHEDRIHAGTILYRFIDTQRSPGRVGADGPWWFEFEHFQTIKHFALRHGYPLGYAARLFAAILYEWSEVNGVVRAQVLQPLSVWKGKGKQIIVGKDRPLLDPEVDARDRNRTSLGSVTEKQPVQVSKMTPMQGPKEVYQLYIPGLGRPHCGFSKYFMYLTCESIQSA